MYASGAAFIVVNKKCGAVYLSYYGLLNYGNNKGAVLYRENKCLMGVLYKYNNGNMDKPPPIN